jgi:chitinase
MVDNNLSLALSHCISVFPALYKQLRIHKESNPNLKILAAVGGWNAGSAPFEQICSSTSSMSSFAQNVITFLRKEKLDGFDLDWEYPSKAGLRGKRMFSDLAQVT